MIISPPKDDELIKRILEKTTFDNVTNCLLYNGYLTEKGYGIIVTGTTKHRVHRVAAAIYLGYDTSDETYQVLHKLECPNKNCWDYNHLYIGTTQDNSGDIRTKKLEETHCIHGHEWTEKNTYIDKRSGRRCKACNNERAKEIYNRNYRKV